MSEWNEYKLSDLMQIKYGKDHKHLADGSFPLYGSGGIMRYVEKPLYSEESILIPRKGTLSNLFYIDQPFWSVDTMFYSKINKDLVLPKYLYYTLKTFDLASLNVGSAVPSLTTEVLNEVLVTIHNLPTQTAIAEILSSLDDKIELNNKINQELENLAQTLFKRWFIDFEFPNENGEPYKSSGGEMLDSELGEIPKGWDVKSLEDIAELVRGISYRKHELVSKENGVPFVNLKCFALDGTFRQDGLKYFSGKFKDSHVIQSNDILVAVTDLTQDRLVIGLPIVWQNEDFALPSLDVCIIRPHQKILKDFLFYEFKTHRYKSRIIEFANGSTVLHLSVKGLETYGIELPLNDLLIQWSEIVNPILKSIGENTKENEKLSKLRDALLTKLISGELEVSVTI